MKSHGIPGEIPGVRKRGNIPILKKGRKEDPGNYQHVNFCVWEDDGTDPPRSYAKEHGGQGGHLRQSALLL